MICQRFPTPAGRVFRKALPDWNLLLRVGLDLGSARGLSLALSLVNSNLQMLLQDLCINRETPDRRCDASDPSDDIGHRHRPPPSAAAIRDTRRSCHTWLATSADRHGSGALGRLWSSPPHPRVEELPQRHGTEPAEAVRHLHLPNWSLAGFTELR